MTLIIILILAGISLSGLIGEKGLFQRTEDASNIYIEKKAREVLETVLLTDGQYEKNTNPKYNQDDFLDDLIKKEIPGSDVKGDVAIIEGEYAYELDRSVPKIGRYLGNPKDLVWPEVIIVNEPTLIENGRKSKFKIRATIDEKATKGITRIELWLNGKKLNQDREYENGQREVEEEYIVNRNGVYTIKAYAELMGNNKTTVEGIVPAIKFSPNGSTEWKKQHTTEIIVEETAETITEMKYVWTDSEDEPTEFTGNCLNNRTVTGGEAKMTGTYYLWVMLKTDTGKVNICGSNGFYFDNEGPTVELTSTPVSETSFTLTATASDNHSGIAGYKFYIDGKEYAPHSISNGVATYTWDGTSMIEKNCYVIVTDLLKNETKKLVKARTKMYAWDTFSINERTIYRQLSASNTTFTGSIVICNSGSPSVRPTFSQDKGYYYENQLTRFVSELEGSSSFWFVDNGIAYQARSRPTKVLFGGGYTFECVKYNISSTTSVTKGENLNHIVYSENPTLYPENGESNGKWYVKRNSIE